MRKTKKKFWVLHRKVLENFSPWPSRMDAKAGHWIERRQSYENFFLSKYCITCGNDVMMWMFLVSIARPLVPVSQKSFSPLTLIWNFLMKIKISFATKNTSFQAWNVWYDMTTIHLRTSKLQVSIKIFTRGKISWIIHQNRIQTRIIVFNTVLKLDW